MTPEPFNNRRKLSLGNWMLNVEEQLDQEVIIDEQENREEMDKDQNDPLKTASMDKHSLHSHCQMKDSFDLMNQIRVK